MVFVAANILLLFGVFTGIGLLWPWTVFEQDRRFESFLICFWVGWGTAVAFLQIWHLFFPVGLPAFLILAGCSVIGWFGKRAAIAQMVRSWGTKQTAWFAGLVVILAVILSNQVLFQQPISDYALYHLQSVKWILSYRIIPGLGNLYNPLATNCSSFLYSAVLNTGWLEGRAYFVSNPLLAFVLLLQCGNGFYSLLTRGKVFLADLFYSLMMPFALLNISTSYLVGYSPDPLVFYLPIVLAGELLRMFLDGQDLDRFRRRAYQLVFLAGVAVTVKLSLGVFSMLCLLPVLYLAITRYRPGLRRYPRFWIHAILLPVLFVVPWVIRNIFLSGFPLYPSPLFPLPVPWSLPYSIPFEASRVIFIWAATNNGAFNYTGNWTWFTQWWHVFPFFARQAFIFTLGLFLLNQLLWLRLRGRVQRDWSATILSLIAVPSLVFWFFMAPSYRLSGSLIWIFFAAELMATFQWVTQAGWVTRPHLAALALVVVVSLWQSPNQFSNNISRRLLFLPPTEQQLDEAAHPLALYQQRVTDSGLVVYIPAPGVEECWNAPLPCTTAANFSPNIHTLKPGDLQSGFSRKQTR